MVAEVAIHFEGHSNLRRGFHKLFEPHVNHARQQRIRFKLIAGGSRTEAVKDFLRSCKSQQSNLNVLLIDSEGPILDTASAIRSLRSQSFWDGSVACDDEQVNLMVQAMEAWFIADPQALINHFGRGFNIKALPTPQNAESVSPSDLTIAIRKGLRNSGRRRYDKVTDGLKLLQLVDHAKVGQYCQHFQRLMDYLSRAI